MRSENVNMRAVMAQATGLLQLKQQIRVIVATMFSVSSIVALLVAIVADGRAAASVFGGGLVQSIAVLAYGAVVYMPPKVTLKTLFYRQMLAQITKIVVAILGLWGAFSVPGVNPVMLLLGFIGALAAYGVVLFY